MPTDRHHAERQHAHIPAPLETARWLITEMHAAIDALPELDLEEVERLVRWTADRCDATLLNLMARQLGVGRMRDDVYRGSLGEVIYVEQRRARSLRDL